MTRPQPTTFCLCCVLFGWALLCALPSPAFAQGDHARRAGAELRVILGDAQSLRDEHNLSKEQAKGLSDRLHGGLAGIRILLRFADQETGQIGKAERAMPANLAPFVNREKLTKLITLLQGLADVYPLEPPSTRSPTSRASDIHSEHCAGCHDEPDLSVERPAYNLFEQAKKQSPPEFLARLIIGVRGDRITGYSNPLTDAELAALIDFYKQSSD